MAKKKQAAAGDAPVNPYRFEIGQAVKLLKGKVAGEVVWRRESASGESRDYLVRTQAAGQSTEAWIPEAEISAA